MPAPTINGKTYEQLNSWERHALDRDNNETFQAMRAQSLRDERAYIQALDVAFHAGAIESAGMNELRAQLDAGTITYAQAKRMVETMPRPHGAA